MKLVRWTRFSWDLTSLTPVYPAIDSHYRVRMATADDERAVRSVVFSAFTLDSNWNFLLRDIREQLDTALDGIFHDKNEKVDPLCLVVTHGSRVIGASALSANREAESHLLTGPCILMEYHNRGLATALLAHSLMLLKEVNITLAHGLTQLNSPTSQFIYTKFGSHNGPYKFGPHLVAS